MISPGRLVVVVCWALFIALLFVFRPGCDPYLDPKCSNRRNIYDGLLFVSIVFAFGSLVFRRPKIYVAGSHTDHETVQRVMKLLSKRYDITFDWTKAEGTENPTEMVRARWASDDMGAVRDADGLVVVLSEANAPYYGTSTELGAALGLGKRVFIYETADCAVRRDNIFFSHPNIRYIRDLEEVRFGSDEDYVDIPGVTGV